VSRPKRPSETNITLRVDADVLLWARVRAGFAGTSVNALIRQFLDEYASVPARFLDGQAWTVGARAVETFREVIDPNGAGSRAREAGNRRTSRRPG
jgi:hypothetical protein